MEVGAELDTNVEEETTFGNIATSQANLSDIDGQITTVRYQLAALLGEDPDRGLSIAVPVCSASDVVALPDNLPADLVSRRPDIVAARWKVEAAMHDVKKAKAEFFPDISLAAAASLDSFWWSRLFRASSGESQAGPAVHVPIFDAGTLRAQLKGRYADVDLDVANYNQELISAFADVATQVGSICPIDREMGDAQRALGASTEAYRLAVTRYKAGLSPQLRVLNADINRLSSEQSVTTLMMRRRDSQLALIKALGGGFDANAASIAIPAAQSAPHAMSSSGCPRLVARVLPDAAGLTFEQSRQRDPGEHFMSETQQSTIDTQTTMSDAKRKLLTTLLVVVMVIAAVAYGLYYFLVAQFHETPDDAYVDGNAVQITPQMTGTVIAVNADDTQNVKIGDPLIVLDDADARVALQQAEANLGQTVRQVSGLFIGNVRYLAQVAQRRADLSRALDDLRRRLTVAQTGALSQEDISHARDAVKAAQAALGAAQQQLESNLALTRNTTIATHPNVLAAAAKVRDAYLNNARDMLPAPIAGYVAKRSVQVGQRVSTGTPLMSVVPLSSVWVEANFKEVQLDHMRIGQPVKLSADIYGSSVVYHGTVAGFSAGTGSAFPLLPAQNATGNWIKVVQRLPVRIALDPKELYARPLRVGLSMQADVDVKNDTGSQLGNAQNTVYETNVFDKYGDEADAEIARIIAQNSNGK
jgi:membrane fusion protein (multidrug efflux system)